MLKIFAILVLGLVGCTHPAPPLEKVRSTEFVPAAGQGRVVIVLSGVYGPTAYSFFPEELARHGYYAVLFNGPDFSAKATGASDNLRQVISLAQRSPHAMPGRVAVIGFSAGGGGALEHATSQSDLVSVVVGYYPQTNTIYDKEEMVRRWNVPAVVFAGDADSNGCCMIDTIRSMVASAKDRGASVELVVYPGAGHDFILRGYKLNKEQAGDAWQRTLDALRRYLGT
jgi:dienelactone hydrolase